MNLDHSESSQSFLVTCGCGNSIPVARSQAGNSLSCPSCGQDVLVPSLSDLPNQPNRVETASKDTTHQVRGERPWQVIWFGIWTFLIAGAGLNVLLAWHAAQPNIGLPGCTGGSLGCNLVITSHYGRVLGFSVTRYAFAFYLAVTLMLFVARQRSAPISLCLPVMTAVGVTAGGWSVWVMLMRIEAICPWCLGLHACNLMLFLFTLAYACQDWWLADDARIRSALPYLPVYLPWSAAAAALVLSLFTLVLFSQFHDQPQLRLVALPEGLYDELKFDDQSSIITSEGNTDAPRTLVVYACYTCPGCKKLNTLLSAMLFEYSGQMRVDVRFSPRQLDCNEHFAEGVGQPGDDKACAFARAALAVAKVEPLAFERYSNWLYSFQGELTVDEALAEARSRVDPDLFDAALDSEDVSERLDRDVSLATRTGTKSVPQLFLSSGHVEGEMLVGAIRRLIETELQLTSRP